MADPYVRHDSQILVGVESTQGTAVTPDRGFGKVDGDTDLPDPTVDWLEERSITGGSQRELTGKYAGQITYDGGSIPIVPVDGFPLAIAFGNDTVTADTNLDSAGSTTSETGTTLHTIDVLDNAIPPTVTIEATTFGRGTGSDFVRTVAGAAPPSATLSIDNESRVQTDLDFLAMDVTEGDSPTTGVSADTRDPWMYHDAESNLSLHGNSYARVTEFEHELTTNVDPRHYIQNTSARKPFEILYANADHETSVSVTPTDDQLFNDLIGASDAGDLSVQLAKPSGEVLRVEATNVGIEEGDHPIPEDGAVEVDLTLIPDTVTVKVTDTSATAAYV